MIKQNAVKCDGEVISDVKATLGAGTYVISVGKRRFARITIA